MSNPGRSDFDAVRESARLYALDRYYAAVFAPPGVRDDLITVAAFTGEIERVAREVSEAPLGDIRIAWWRDALQAAYVKSGNPVLDAFAGVAKRRGFDCAVIERYLDAHARALYASGEGEIDKEIRLIGWAPLLFATQVLGVEIDEETSVILDDAGRAAAATRLALDLPYALKHGREVREPSSLAAEARASLAVVRAQLQGKSRTLTGALLPLALIEPYFRALERAGHVPTRDIVEIAPLVKLWRIAYAHWTGRI